MDLQGLALRDISLLDPTSKAFLSLRSLARQSSRIASEKLWVLYDDAIVYRWNNTRLEANLSCGGVTAEDLNRFWNDERKPSNLLLLLIDLNGHKLTLRFHPQHGDREGVQKHQAGFQIALHRARPDCGINWIG